MKNTITAIMLSVATAFSAYAGSLTEKEMKALDGYANDGRIYFNDVVNSSIRTNKQFTAAADEYLFAKNKFVVIPQYMQKCFPKTTTLMYTLVSDKYPVLASLNGIAPEVSDEKYIKFTFEKFLFEIEYNNYNQYTIGTTHVINTAKEIQKGAVYVIRRHLRKIGKSFVTKKVTDNDGNVTYVNPTSEHMEQLTAILNSGRFAGLDQWMIQHSVSPENVVSLQTTVIPTDTELNAIKEKVLNGEVNFKEIYQLYFRFAYGTQGYNDFIKLYNDGIKD